MMAHDSHHLAEFSPPSNPAMATAAAPGAFDHGHSDLLALQDGIEMRGLFHRDLPDHPSTSSWQQAATNDAAMLRSLSLSLFNARGASVGHQAFALPVAPSPSSTSTSAQLLMQPFQLRSSKYLAPAKELLSEFCSLGEELHAMNTNKRAPRTGKWEEVEASSSSSSWANQSLSSMDILELERSKARLLSMVEEVDRRYRRYHEQMRTVELSFEAVAGAGSARVYSELALRAMSRHFRCLRDAIVRQIRTTRKAMGDKDTGTAMPGTTKGDTPRLRVLDQCLRQQRAFQQTGTVENYPWRPQRGLPERSVSILRSWLFEHFLHPYPSDVDKHLLARQTGLSRSQVSNWFINARVRLWKPMIEDMYVEEMKQQEGGQPSNAAPNQNLNPSHDDKKPATAGAEGLHLSHSLISTIIDGNVDIAGGDQFRAAYTSMRGGGAVSLTLGLQQHSTSGLSSFSVPSTQQSFLLSREHDVDDGGGGAPMHFGMLDEEEEEAVLPYRNLMGSELLHDLA